MRYLAVDFGAKGDGITDCTGALRKCAALCQSCGGGEIYLSAGRYLTGPLQLYSNTTLFLENGAQLMFTGDFGRYPTVISRWEGEPCRVYMPLIFADGAENVCIRGDGVLDGNGAPWWKAHLAGQLEFPRPQFVVFQNCRNVKIEGVTFQNAPAWTIHPLLSDGVYVHGITIYNPDNSPNTDGIDPESCKNVRISDCHISVGDDCIALKSGMENSGPLVPLENVVITNCVMERGHGGVVAGSEMSGGIFDVTVSNCVFRGTDRGIRIKTRRGRGGEISRLHFSNIIMDGVMCPFVINMYYHCGKGGSAPEVAEKKACPVTERTPRIRDIRIQHITARNVTASAGYFYGLLESRIAHVTMTDISVSMCGNTPDTPAMMKGCPSVCRRGFWAAGTRQLLLRDFAVSGQEGEAVVICEDEQMKGGER